MPPGMQHFSLKGGGLSTALRANLRPRPFTAIATTAALTVCAGVYYHQRIALPKTLPEPTRTSTITSRLQINATFVEMLAGAVGELASILVLYPLDTIKDLLKKGFTLNVVKKLYAGILGGALCSIIVGSVHFASYESMRRLVLEASARQNGANGSVSSSTNVSLLPDAGSLPATPVTSELYASGTSAEAGIGSCPSKNKFHATVFAAVFAAFITAMIESPVELFRHNQQAGCFKGSFLKEMVRVVRKEGPAGLYWGFLPHCFEAWPHDVSELLVYGAMMNFAEEAAEATSKHHAWMRHVPVDAFDLAVGGMSGAAAILVSMPMDSIKTYMQTHGTDLRGKGVLGSAQLFVKAGRKMVASRGLGSLYYGVAPRLLQQVPSSMLLWWSLHAVQRTMLPFTKHSTVNRNSADYGGGSSSSSSGELHHGCPVH